MPNKTISPNKPKNKMLARQEFEIAKERRPPGQRRAGIVDGGLAMCMNMSRKLN